MKEKITKQELVEKIKAVDNILIVTSSSPKIDYLSACVGLFQVLRDLENNPAFVYSKDIPGTINFLEPEKVIQKDPESLRDFIISFDHAKVDKFRYNQETDQYNILLTPARLQVITEADMKYRKGDFNIDLILALGIESKGNIDPAIGEHSQLINEIPLVNIVAGKKDSSWDTLCWKEESASSLSEMVYELSQAMDESKKISKQTANALLTGIIAQTERYKDKQTKAHTMHISAELLELGADLQLINENLAQLKGMPAEIPEAETKAMVEEALGEASDYNTQLIKNKKKKASSKGSRAYMRQGDVEAGLSYGEKIGSQKGEEEYQLDQLNIDEEGNLRIISEETENAANRDHAAVAADASQPAAPAPLVNPSQVPATPSNAAVPAGAQSDRAQTSPLISRNVLTPSAQSQQAPSLANPGANQAPILAAGNAGVANHNQMQNLPQSPSINEIVDRTAGGAEAVAPNVPAVPGLNEKVDALSPVNNTNANSYIDSLVSPPAVAPQSTPPPVAGNPGQAMTVDNYLAQQPNPVQNAAPPNAGNNPYAPPAAPPLASMT